jgi:predicted ATP-dependent serine protease
MKKKMANNFCTQCGDVDSVHDNQCNTCKAYEADKPALQSELLILQREIREHEKKLYEMHDIIEAKKAKIAYIRACL